MLGRVCIPIEPFLVVWRSSHVEARDASPTFFDEVLVASVRSWIGRPTVAIPAFKGSQIGRHTIQANRATAIGSMSNSKIIAVISKVGRGILVELEIDYPSIRINRRGSVIASVVNFSVVQSNECVFYRSSDQNARCQMVT